MQDIDNLGIDKRGLYIRFKHEASMRKYCGLNLVQTDRNFAKCDDQEENWQYSTAKYHSEAKHTHTLSLSLFLSGKSGDGPKTVITAEGFRRLTYCVDSDGKVLSDWVTMNDDVLRKTTNVWCASNCIAPLAFSTKFALQPGRLRNNQPIDAAALNKPNSSNASSYIGTKYAGGKYSSGVIWNDTTVTGTFMGHQVFEDAYNQVIRPEPVVSGDGPKTVITAEGFRRLTYCVDSDGKVLSDWVTMNDDVLRKTTNVWCASNCIAPLAFSTKFALQPGRLRNNQPIDAAALNKPNSSNASSYIGTKYAGGKYSRFAVRRKDPSSPVLATPTHAPRGSTSNATSSRRDYSPRPYSSSTGPYRRYTPPRSTSSTGP
ncbi:hypothetical protein JADG_004466 [Aureobasidium aubasidani]|nr:hypothetical protein JADG_004466 [Aureobasidium pullulans]